MTQKPSAGAILAFRKLNRLFGAVASLTIAAILAVIALTVVVILTRWDAMAAQTLRRLALAWSPTPFYLWALWSLRTMFADLARAGPTFRPVLAVALVRIGWALMLGAGTTLIVAPIILTMAPPHGMGGGFATFNVPALTLGIVGLALIATAHVLRRGMEIEAEAISLKIELAEFL